MKILAARGEVIEIRMIRFVSRASAAPPHSQDVSVVPIPLSSTYHPIFPFKASYHHWSVAILRWPGRRVTRSLPTPSSYVPGDFGQHISSLLYHSIVQSYSMDMTFIYFAAAEVRE